MSDEQAIPFKLLPKGNRKVRMAIFILFVVFVTSILVSAQSQQDVATNMPEVKDANATSGIPESVESTESQTQITVEELQKQKKQIDESQDLSDEIKTKVSETYDKAIAGLKLAAEFDTKKQQYSQARKDAPNNLMKTKELLANQATAVLPETDPGITLAQAEQALTQARQILEEAKNNVPIGRMSRKNERKDGPRYPRISRPPNKGLKKFKPSLLRPRLRSRKPN